MYVHPLSNIDNQVDVGIVVVVGSPGYLDILVGHSNVVGVRGQVFRRGHGHELDGPLIAKCLVSPLADGANLLDGGDTIVRNENLSSQYAQRKERSMIELPL